MRNPYRFFKRRASDCHTVLWVLPDFDAPQEEAPPQIRAAQVAEYEARGFQRGKTEGYALGVAEAEHRLHQQAEESVAKNSEILRDLSSIQSQIYQQLSDYFIETLSQVLSQIIRVESQINPEILKASLATVLEKLPTLSGQYVVFAHPEDCTRLEAYCQIHYPAVSFQFQPDANLLRGGFRLQGPHVFVDATLEQRLIQLVTPSHVPL